MQKNWWTSKTIIGAGLVLVAGVVEGAGLTLDPVSGNFSGNVYEIAGRLGPLALQVVGGGLAIWGRMRATKAIKPILTQKRRAR